MSNHPPITQTPAGEPIETIAQWQAERERILDVFAEQVYGRVPGELDDLTFEVTNEDPHAMHDRATLKQIGATCRYEGRTLKFSFMLFVPNHAPRPAPVMLLINNRLGEHTDATREHMSEFWPAELVIDRGYAVAAIRNRGVAPDDKDTWRDEGVVPLFEGDAGRQADAWGVIAMWAWGASRVMDYFETDADVDATRVAVIGHSRGGKAALWAGAHDTRFALTVSNNSGCTGAALASRAQGETIEQINDTFPHWFALNYRQYNGRDDELPVDQHQLIASVAPRAVYVASADKDAWADPVGEFTSLALASPVFALHGSQAISTGAMPGVAQTLFREPMAYHLAPGGHGLHTYSWSRFMDFADRLWQRDAG